ncbi:hypothetical protein EUGRSUZ_D02414 [Eucalyptus grandis]|uniref:Uncharacterized protein n=1 Tax=Eucalyptus grandis TaxID=71139 RepID=A0A059CJ07_EUCGR|nr:hypothetical protein EUGRSUZ_D02414 [Eucalyptus grandis]
MRALVKSFFSWHFTNRTCVMMSAEDMAKNNRRRQSPRLDLFRQVLWPRSKPLPPSSVKSLPSPETIPAATRLRGELHGVIHCNSWRQPMYRRLHQIQVLCATRPSKAPSKTPSNKNRE